MDSHETVNANARGAQTRAMKLVAQMRSMSDEEVAQELRARRKTVSRDEYDDLQEAYDTDVYGMRVQINELRLERDLARRGLSAAPHSNECASLIPMKYHPAWRCDCWKSVLDIPLSDV